MTQFVLITLEDHDLPILPAKHLKFDGPMAERKEKVWIWFEISTIDTTMAIYKPKTLKFALQ
jgi:hypothetical protein